MESSIATHSPASAPSFSSPNSYTRGLGSPADSHNADWRTAIRSASPTVLSTRLMNESDDEDATARRCPCLAKAFATRTLASIGSPRSRKSACEGDGLTRQPPDRGAIGRDLGMTDRLRHGGKRLGRPAALMLAQ